MRPSRAVPSLDPEESFSWKDYPPQNSLRVSARTDEWNFLAIIGAVFRSRLASGRNQFLPHYPYVTPLN